MCTNWCFFQLFMRFKDWVRVMDNRVWYMRWGLHILKLGLPYTRMMYVARWWYVVILWLCQHIEIRMRCPTCISHTDQSLQTQSNVSKYIQDKKIIRLQHVCTSESISSSSHSNRWIQLWQIIVVDPTLTYSYLKMKQHINIMNHAKTTTWRTLRIDISLQWNCKHFWWLSKC